MGHKTAPKQAVKITPITITNIDFFTAFVGFCSGRKTKRSSVNNSNVQRSFLGLKKNWASVQSVLDIERVNYGSLHQSSDVCKL